MTADRLDLDALEALIDAGSKGTWRLDGTWWLESVDYRVVASENNPEIAFSDDDDGALIVALRNAAPALIAAARQATGDTSSLWRDSAAGWRERAERAEAERDAAQAALDRVEVLHSRGSFGRCDGCSAVAVGAIDDPEWPCATIRAVVGEGQEAGGK